LLAASFNNCVGHEIVLEVAVQVAGFKGDRSLLLAFVYVYLIRAGIRQTIYKYTYIKAFMSTAVMVLFELYILLKSAEC
jgi:hypothetical protein